MIRLPLFCFIRPDEGSWLWRLAGKLLSGMDSFGRRLCWGEVQTLAWRLFAAWRTPLVEKRLRQDVEVGYKMAVNA